MRGRDEGTDGLFSYVSCESRVPKDHPLRAIRVLVNEALAALSADFDALYADDGRASVAPERLLRASLLQAFYSVRSERQLMEQIDYNLLFRWFVGLGVDDPVWHPTTFTYNRDRLLQGDVAARFLSAVLTLKEVKALLSAEHFSVDGTLIEAWASQKSFRLKRETDKGGPDTGDAGGGRNAERNFKGEKRSNETHASTTDSDARLYRKGNGQPARLCFMGHLLMENRSGLIVAATLTHATGTAEREAALLMIERTRKGARRITLGADKAYDTSDFVKDLRKRKVTPHIAVNDHITKTGSRRKSAIDGRTTRHPGYAVSQRIRKRIEEPIGWTKTVAGLTKTRFRGLLKVGWDFTLKAAAANLVRLPKLLATA